MLSVNAPILKQKLNQLIATNSSPMYDAAYNAYLNISKSNMNKVNVDDEDTKSIVDAEVARCEQKMKDDARQFANDFCKGLKDGGFMDTIADEIDGHVKAIKLMITMMPQGLASIISPMGPCTGSMIIDDTTAMIQIL